MQKTIFLATMTILGLVADFMFSFTWSLILSLPIVFVSWWIAYKSGWFD